MQVGLSRGSNGGFTFWVVLWVMRPLTTKVTIKVPNQRCRSAYSVSVLAWALMQSAGDVMMGL
jgi:hypothetical protein